MVLLSCDTIYSYHDPLMTPENQISLFLLNGNNSYLYIRPYAVSIKLEALCRRRSYEDLIHQVATPSRYHTTRATVLVLLQEHILLVT
jgi:hypothetical protein